ncbi:MAG: YbaK/EbsC family protein [Deltaproteobacteria bacterium]|nr:YbaK/EbsC family protein [Deltaproteobacteria bacterium]
MAVLKRLEDYLRENHADYKEIIHPEAYTAQEVAAAMHVHGKELAKSVMVKADGKYVMTVLPANWQVDFRKLREVLHQERIELAKEDEFRMLFPDCETGAEPPFGNLYNVETLVDKSLAEDENIFFNAGTHYEAVEMKYKDYEKLAKPRVAEFSKH